MMQIVPTLEQLDTWEPYLERLWIDTLILSPSIEALAMN